MIKHMKERYAFRYNEFLQQQKETGKIFASDNCLNALLCDVDYRYKGKEFIHGNAAFSKLGVRVNGNLNLTGNLDFLTDTYGADAVRIALIEELPLTDANLTGCWRFVGNLWRLLKQEKLNANFSDLKIYECIQNKNYEQALIALKSAIKHGKIGRDIFKLCYPFMPHLILSFNPEIHSQMMSFWQDVWKMSFVKKMFVEINGKKVLDFYPKTKEKQEIIEEVLSFDKIKRKITDKPIKRIIFIPEKGVNFVV